MASLYTDSTGLRSRPERRGGAGVVPVMVVLLSKLKNNGKMKMSSNDNGGKDHPDNHRSRSCIERTDGTMAGHALAKKAYL